MLRAGLKKKLAAVAQVMLFHRSGQIAGQLALRIERAIIRVLREMVDRFLKLNADSVMEPVHAVAGVIDHQPRHARHGIPLLRAEI